MLPEHLGCTSQTTTELVLASPKQLRVTKRRRVLGRRNGLLPRWGIFIFWGCDINQAFLAFDHCKLLYLYFTSWLWL